jgi:group I intron endonuclease
MATGVYIIENTVTGHFYIGSATASFESRWKSHWNDLRGNRHHSDRLQNSYNKYGESVFKFKVIVECAPELCIKKEQFYMDTLEPEFNMNPTAGNCLGRKFSEESKLKMSESAKKRGVHPSFLLNHVKKEVKAPKKKYSRVVPGARDAYAKKLSAGEVTGKNEAGEEIKFDSTRAAERHFKELGMKFNKVGLTANINQPRMYYGYYWTRNA